MTDDASERAFNADTVWEWQTTLREALPGKPLTGPDVPGLDVVSFNTSAGGDALAIRLRARDGSEVDVLTNPVVAIELMRRILQAGQIAGWIDDNGNISFPPLGDPRP